MTASSITHPLKVLIADDQYLYREGIKSLLSEEASIEVEISVSNGGAIMDYLQQHPVDIILMDIDMPGMNGIEATRLVREA
ncbi:MAG: response regulator transcription factor, partial [Tunicatimonas sp.]|uniref:response regulator n=1 Tax=Tunicatimonas sp. TaxID=1940096 RepID=UPI003C76CF5A